MNGNEKRERRYVTSAHLRIEQRAEGELPVIEGYAAVFNVEADLGWFREVVRPGAFANSLRNGDDVRALFNHDSNHVLGRNKAGTLELAEDQKGLRYRIIPPDTQFARDLIKSIDRGDVTQSSFGFEVVSQQWNDKEGEAELRELTELRLFDVSPVTFPAYIETDVSVGKRSLEQHRKYVKRMTGADADRLIYADDCRN